MLACVPAGAHRLGRRTAAPARCPNRLRRGFRLGYGSGYFDRFLAGRPFPAIGLAYDCPLVDELPAEPHDVALAVVVTPVELCRQR